VRKRIKVEDFRGEKEASFSLDEIIIFLI
jgi:hypothetical protein